MRIFSFGSSGLAAGVMLPLMLVGCNPDQPGAAPPTDEALQVVVTNTILANLAETVAGDEAEVQSLLAPGDDPHIYEPTPRDSIVLEQADVVFYNGYNLAPELIRIIEGTSVTAETVALAETLTPLSFDYDGQTEPDPHVWGDVENAIALTEGIRDTLIAADPEAEATYQANAEQLIGELSQLDSWIETQVATIPPDQRLLVTTHDAFQYYTTAYGLEMLGTLIGISTEEQPSAQTVQQLVDAIRTTGVPAIFAETTINPQLIRTVAEEANVTLAPAELYSDSLGAPGSGGETYVDMMVSNTETIVDALGGEIQSFK